MSGKRTLTHPHAAHAACNATSARIMNLLAPEFEYLDPNPDIHALFMEYNGMFFDGKLAGCEVKWSKRMTLCAGLCSYQPSSGFCSIRLSEPLLKLRPRSDLINTLLHEMIHAFVFVSSPVRDRDDHGPIFQSHMNRINQSAGTVITVYHTFHDEVDTYRQHWWQCDGSCRRKPPYFGVVKRAMNRPPGPLDRWWEDHQKTCDGTYTKIKDPPGFKEKQEKKLLRQQQKKEKEKAAPSVKQFFSSTVKGESDAHVVAGGAGSNLIKPSANKKPRVVKPTGTKAPNKDKKDEPTWLDGLRNPTSPEGGGDRTRGTEAATPKAESSSSIPFAVPENAVLFAGDDGEYYLVGDVSAMFQAGNTPVVRPLLPTGDTSLVDLTETDDEDQDHAKSQPRVTQDVSQRPPTARSKEVEVIEID